MTTETVRVSTGLPPQPYAEEWRRSCPDYLAYHPAPDGDPRWEDDSFFCLNEHFIVVALGGDRLLATWTAHGPGLRFRRVVVSRSEDGGISWGEPKVVDGGPQASAAWSVPVVNGAGRIYLLYSYYGGDHRLHGGACGMAWRVSDDGGASWSDRVVRTIRPAPVDADDGASSFLFWRQAEWDAHGRPLLGFTRLAMSPSLAERPPKRKWCQSECLRIENLDVSPDPAALRLSYLPAETEEALKVPQPEEPEISWANEPSFVPLPDGRILAILRTRTGHLWYSVGDASGRFDTPSVMRQTDGGPPMEQPGSPAPLFRLDDERFLLLFNNNDGHAFGANETHDPRNRRPAYLALGRFRPEAEQPIAFGEPTLFIDNDGVPVEVFGNEPRYEAAAYGSLTPARDGAVLWYPDRKHFLLGKHVPESLLSQLEAS